ncbi:glycosyltransferase family 4 protein [Desulfosarcina alkanivorans]|uniref:glycosyltransferase family 4 protein n=1 Tax=Desulfosarcina alkanivorans TaxID=571177 RepID=UPI0012D34EF4|nr:glycosyltransferase family 1 protein [Desulfosarcina alkanivorans]
MASPTVVIDITPILPGGENGGAKVFAVELIRGLARLAPQAEFILLTQAASHDELANLDIENVRRMMVFGTPGSAVSHTHVKGFYSNLKPRLPGFFRRRLAQGAYIVSGFLKRAGRRRILQQIGADLLFCPFTAPTFFDRNVPTVCTIHDLQFAGYPQFFEPEDVAYRKSTFLNACRKATMLVAVSDYSRNSAIAYCNLASNKIRTIHSKMAQRISSTETADTEILKRLEVSPQRYLLYPANFWKHKNHEMLITAFGMACAQGLPQDIKLVFTGAPNARKDFIQNAVGAFSLAHRVAFAGYLNNFEFSILLNNAGGLIFPSLYEGFGLPVIEAMAVGVPVACSNVTSLPEVAGSAAVFFDPKRPLDIAQALIALVNDKALRNQLVEDGYRQSELFSDTELMASDYWGVFISVLSGNLNT